MGAATPQEREESFEPEALWSLPAAVTLAWREWDADEAVVYNRASGGTHLIDAFSVAALRRIAEGPCRFDLLAAHIVTACGAGEDEVRARLKPVLDRLRQLGLAEHMARCGSAS